MSDTNRKKNKALSLPLIILFILTVIDSSGFMTTPAESSDMKLLTFGAVADIQYNDKEPPGVRYHQYRTSLWKLEEAVNHFNQQ